MHAFEGRAGGHLSTPIGAALGRRKEQVCTAGVPMAFGAAVRGAVSDRKDMLRCPCRMAVGCQNPGVCLLLLWAVRQCAA